MNRSQLNTAQLNASAGGRAVTTFATRYTASIAPVVLTAIWSVAATCRRAMIAQWAATPQVRRAVDATYATASPARKALGADWACAPALRRAVDATYGVAAACRRALSADYASASPARRTVTTTYGDAVPARAMAHASYAAESSARALLRGVYALSGAMQHSVPVVTLTAPDQSWPIEDVELTQTSDSPLWSASMTVLSAPPALGQDVDVTLQGITWAMRVTDVDASRTDPVDGGWTVRAASPASTLADIDAADSLPHGGMASVVCAALCAPWSVSWTVADYYIAPPVLADMADSSCLDAASRIAAIVGVLRCQPDGTMRVSARSGGVTHAPHAVEASIDLQPEGSGIRVSPWDVSDSISVDGDGRSKTATVIISPARTVDLLIEGATAGQPVTESRTVTETIGLVSGLGSVGQPIAALISAVTGAGQPVPLAFWPGQRTIWADSPTHAPVTITYQTTYITLPVTLPVGTQAVHLLVEDPNE